MRFARLWSVALGALCACSTSPRSVPSASRAVDPTTFRTDEPVLEGELPAIPGGVLDRVLHEGTNQVLSEGYRVAGEREGTWRFFHADGSRHSAAVYERGRRVGVWYRWHEGTEQLAERSHWNGTLHGPLEAWHRSGQLQRRGTYQEGDRVGAWEHLDENGAPVER